MVSHEVNEYRPDYVSHPGESLKEILLSIGMKQNELADRIGKTAKHISEIINGKAPITPETARQFEIVMSIPSSFWMNRQQHYDDYMIRLEETQMLLNQLDWVDNFPYAKMASYGWVSKTRDKLEKFQNLLSFFGVVSPITWQDYWGELEVSWRKSDTFSPDTYSLVAWLCKGEIEAQKLYCEPYDKDKLLNALEDIKPITRNSTDIKSDIQNICNNCGVAVVFVPELPKTASGATYWLTKDKAVIQLSLKYKTDDHLWFTFFHEIAHILLHHKKSIFIEGGNNQSIEENEANKFASNLLIPPNELSVFLQENPQISKSSIQEFAKKLGISPGIVVGHLQHKQYLRWDYCNDLKQRFSWVES